MAASMCRPRFKSSTTATTDKVEVRLRFSQISVALLVDRDGDGVLSGNIASLPPCFGPSPDTIHECVVGGVPQRQRRRPAFHSPGSTAAAASGAERCARSEHGNRLRRRHRRRRRLRPHRGVCPRRATLDKLNERLRNSTPDLKTKGLDFGGLVSFEGAKLIAIENDGSPEFQDYIAITGKLVVPPPN